MDLGLTDRVYVITGATRGLGFASAQQLVAEGARVVVTGRSAEAAEAAAAELGEGRAVGVAADNADPAAPARLVEAARSHFGRLDGVLVSVGGPPAGVPVTEVDDEQWRSAFDSVFLGAVRMARAVAAELTEGGVIGFVLSSSVHEPVPGLGISNGLRPGLAGFAKTLANELGPRGIRVLGLLPGRIGTERLAYLDSLADGADGSAARKRNAETIPLRRYGSPEEFGRTAAFLLSPAASYLTGVMLPVDGGARHGF
ncbi:SDR family oxidoreductase [Streptomyces sp. AJS327]|uniref:SDR family oxidoreductase n=1 Tax=Streptomyces sp. AJS327 TaxID=2545265 RepID=UPI0015DDA044|nr:SDR family oxidoreductase [Streptomyces sp. AJS327]MBA0050498.1 SDR family oxidoreductase [Streptomyces sp. AJS327]